MIHPDDFRRAMGDADGAFEQRVRQTLCSLEHDKEVQPMRKIRMGAVIAIALLRARAAALGITELVQKEGSLRFSLPQPDFAKVAAVCGLEKYKGRLLFSAGDKPYLSLRLKKGDDVLKLAGIVLRDFEAAG